MLVKTLAGLLALTASGVALAGTQTWDFVNDPSAIIENNDAHGIGSGSYIDITNDGIELVISAWSSTQENGPNCAGNPVCDSGSNAYDPDPFITRAALKQYGGGLGAVNVDETDDQPNHAFDSVLGPSSTIDYDMALLQFDTEVVLTELDINWKGSDSDMTVLNYTGTSDISGTPFSSSSNWYDLLSQGWSVVGNYNDVSTSSNQIISNAVESKYWLIGVYNPAFGENWSVGNDAIKLAGVKTKTFEPSTQVPEPAGLALVMLGLIGLASRRK